MITISLGNHAEFYITDDKRMGIRQMFRGEIIQNIPLGSATRESLIELVTYMVSLLPHTAK